MWAEDWGTFTVAAKKNVDEHEMSMKHMRPRCRDLARPFGILGMSYVMCGTPGGGSVCSSKKGNYKSATETIPVMVAARGAAARPALRRAGGKSPAPTADALGGHLVDSSGANAVACAGASAPESAVLPHNEACHRVVVTKQRAQLLNCNPLAC